MRMLVAFLMIVSIGIAVAGAVPWNAARIVNDVVYRTVDDIELRMDIYYPKTGDSPYAVVLYVHGGAWISGTKSGGAGMLDVPVLLAHGYVVVSVDYRLAPRWKFPAQIEDVKCVVRYLRAHANELKIDSDHIGAYGGSAGGHLVALLGTLPDDLFSGDCPWQEASRVQAVVDMFGPADSSLFDFEGWQKAAEQVFGVSDSNDPIFAQASPVTWTSFDDPPFLILHGDQDQIVPLSQSQSLYDHLVAAGVTADLVVVKDAGHGFRPMGEEIIPSRDEISEMIASFFDRWLKE